MRFGATTPKSCVKRAMAMAAAAERRRFGLVTRPKTRAKFTILCLSLGLSTFWPELFRCQNLDAAARVVSCTTIFCLPTSCTTFYLPPKSNPKRCLRIYASQPASQPVSDYSRDYAAFFTCLLFLQLVGRAGLYLVALDHYWGPVRSPNGRRARRNATQRNLTQF